MEDGFLVADTSHVWRGQNPELPEFLESRGLYKSLSLLLAHRAEIRVPPSLLLLALRRDLVKQFAEEYGLPLMIRLDYGSRPAAKPLGGIPVYSLEIVARVCENLLDQACLPLLHPNLDRFEDQFSAGVLLSHGTDEADFEIVGRGFDAGDLRLGKAVPHESLVADLAAGTTKHHKVLADDVYQRQRALRLRMMRKLKAYTRFVNESASLLADLNRFDGQAAALPNPEVLIPARYEPMPNDVLRKLLGVARRVKADVLQGLSKSKVYVASMSYLPKEGWVLWDVYGDWYFR